MPMEVPPTIEAPKSIIGIGTRELMILAVGGVLALLIFTFPMDLAIKIFLAVLFVGLGIAAAFGRDPKTGKTLEQYLASLMNYRSRARFQQRGAVDYGQAAAPVKVVAGSSTGAVAPPQPVVVTPSPDQSGSYEQPNPGGLFQMAPLPLEGSLFLGIISLAFLAALMTWLWGGGAAEMISTYGIWH